MKQTVFWRGKSGEYRPCFKYSLPIFVEYKMWIKQEPNKSELWNKLYFEEEKTESIDHVWNIHYLSLLNIKYE